MTLRRAISLSIKHWQDNIEKIEAMDMDRWENMDSYDRLLAIPIGSTSCALCKYQKQMIAETGEWFQCPLAPEDANDGDMYCSTCCEEWCNTYRTMIYGRHSKAEIVAAMRAMLERLERLKRLKWR